MEDRDFIDFEFNGHWASEFNLLAVSNGDRYSNSFYGSVNPNTVEMVGKTGVYKWKTQIGEKRFSINIAYDDIDLGTLRKIKEWLNPFVISKLTFKEEPYKYYWVSLADDPEISFLPFRTDDVVVDGKSYKKGVFKGDVTLNFICADNFGYSDWQSFDEDYDYLVEEISDVSNFSFDNGSDNNLIITEIKGNSAQDVVKPVAYTHVEGKNLGLKSQYKDIRNLKVLGASQQETTQGYNLLNVPDDYHISSTDINKIVPISLKANTIYTIQAEKIISDNSDVKSYLFRFRYNNADVSNPYARIPISTLKTTYTSPSDIDTVWIYSGTSYNESATTNTTYTNLMIYEGTAEKSYEPYTGGVPSPNPNYLQEIQNVGDDVNLAYISSKTDYNYSSTLEKDAVLINGTSTNAGNIVLYLNGDDGITLKANKKYIVSLFFDGDVTGNGYKTIYLQGMPIGDIASNKMVTKEIILSEDKVCKTINLDLSANCTFDNMKVKVMITENGKLKEYIPYNCIKVTISNKNLFNPEWLMMGNLSTEGQEFSQNNYARTKHISVEPNENLSITMFDTTNFRASALCFYDKDKNLIKRTVAPSNVGWDNFSTMGNCKYIRFTIAVVGSKYSTFTEEALQEASNNLQLEKGVSTSYIPHEEQKIIFPLAEGQKLYEGSYLAADGIHHKRKQVILNAKTSENWYLGKTSDDTWKTDVFCLQLLNVSKINFSVTILSNYFKNKLVWSIDNEGIFLQSSNETLMVRLNKDRLEVPSSVDSFKTWLSTHNIIVEYEIAQEEIIPYTTTQRQIYDKLKDLTIKDGYTHLSIDGLGSISLDYNGYDGSPSPAYPSKIRTVGSNINLFDKDNYTELSLQLTPATKTLNTSTNERGTYFKCKPNTIYSFQKSTNGTVYLRGNVCETQVVPTDGCSYDNYISFSLINKISYKTSATAKYIYFNFYCTTSDISKQELLNSIKIEEEPENTALSAYNKANVETKIENANYYNPANGFNYGTGAANTTTVNADGTITTISNYSNSRGKGTPVYLKKNTNYYLSLELVSLTVSAGDEKYIAAEVIGYNKFGGGANRVSQIFNIRQTEIGTRWVGQFNSGDCDRWALHISGWFGNSNNGTATYKNVMVSEQNIDYMPNETQTVTMPIQQELLTGDYIKDTEHHEWGKLIVTGQENWNQYNRSLTDGYFGAFLAKDDVKNTGIVVCNKLPQESSAVYNTTGYGVANFMEGYLYICLRREDFGASDTTSLADCTTLLKAYLAKCYADGDPFIIYYKVKKPVDLELTQEQKNTQNFAKNFVFSYPGTNRVYADNDVVKLSASYVPEQNINIDFMVEGSNLLDSSAFYYQNDIFLKAYEDKESGDATKSGISEERPVYLYNAGNKDAALKLNFDLIIPAENSPLTIQIEKGKMTENGFSKISDYSQIAISDFAHYRPFVDIFDGHLENWQIEIDSNLCEVYVKHKTDKTKIISLNKFNENQSFLSLAGSEIVDYAKAFPTSLEEIKNSAIEGTIFNKVTIAPCAQSYRLKNVSLDWKHTYL